MRPDPKVEMPDPFYSIVMPVHNGQPYVSESIESVLAQSDLDWELVIVDDFSADQTPVILEDYASRDKRIRVISNGENIAVAKSLNRGIREARGRWIVRLDADDRFTPGYLTVLRMYIENAGEDSFFSSWVTVIDEAGKKILDIRLPQAEMIQSMMPFENFLYHPATTFSKQLWEKAGEYPEDPAVSEDTAMWNAFFSVHAKLVMVPEFLVNYRLHYTNLTSVKDARLLSMSGRAQKAAMIRQNREWRISLYLKQKMLKLARAEIVKIGRTQKSLSFKNLQYFLLTFLPESFAAFYMWKIRPYLRTSVKKIKGILRGRKAEGLTVLL